jgi:hypothetical protein
MNLCSWPLKGIAGEAGKGRTGMGGSMGTGRFLPDIGWGAGIGRE